MTTVEIADHSFFLTIHLKFQCYSLYFEFSQPAILPHLSFSNKARALIRGLIILKHLIQRNKSSYTCPEVQKWMRLHPMVISEVLRILDIKDTASYPDTSCISSPFLFLFRFCSDWLSVTNPKTPKWDVSVHLLVK